jgi:hypothetical protein
MLIYPIHYAGKEVNIYCVLVKELSFLTKLESCVTEKQKSEKGKRDNFLKKRREKR